jgi:hypothetical protein
MHMLIRLSWQTLVFVEDSHSTAAGSFEAPLQGKNGFCVSNPSIGDQWQTKKRRLEELQRLLFHGH